MNQFKFFRSLILCLILCAPLFSQDERTVALGEFGNRIEQSAAQDLDLRTGRGTGQWILSLRKLALEMRRDPRLQSINADGSNIQTHLMSAFGATPTQPKIFKVDLRPEMIAFTNRRLKDSGFGFIQVEATDAAFLLSKLYDLASPKYDRVPLESLIALTARVYPDLNGKKVIRVPHYDSEFLKAIQDGLAHHAHRMELDGYKFELDPNVKSEKDVCLPNPAKPLDRERTFNRILKNIRLGLVVPLGLLGSAMSGNWAPTAWSAGSNVLGQEANFILNSGSWNQFWQKFGLRGNIAMNMNFASLVTTMMVLTGAGMHVIEGLDASLSPSLKMAATVALSAASFVGGYYALKFINMTKKLSVVAGMVGAMAATVLVLGHYANINLPEFLIKSLVISTATFVASFGLGQIKLGDLNQNGELGEGRRFPFESYLNFFGAVPRTIALGAVALAATQAPWFNLSDIAGDVQLLGINWTDIKFAKVEVFAWATQLIVFAAVGLPLVLKSWKGDSAVDAQTREVVMGASAPKRGLITRVCDGALGFIARLYTPSWAKSKS